MNFYSLNHFLIFHVKTDDCDDMKKILHIEKRPSLIAKMDNYALKSKKISLAQLSPSLTNTKNKLILWKKYDIFDPLNLIPVRLNIEILKRIPSVQA